MSRKKNHEDEPPDDNLDELVESVQQEKPPGAFDVQVEDYVADGPSDKPGPTIEVKEKPKSEHEFGIDLSHLTPSARERTLAELREGAAQVAKRK